MKGVKSIIYKDSRGAILADEHYHETGHLIKESGKISSPDFSGKQKFTIQYDCSECDFKSYAGEIFVKCSI